MATLTSLVPNHAALNEPPVLVSVNGTGFTATSKVHVKDVPVSTTFVSATLLRGVINPGTIADIGVELVKVEEPAGTFTSTLPFTVGIDSTETDGGVLVEAPDPWPYEYQYIASTNSLGVVVGTVGWPDGAENT
jgi:IPT/TIG domain